MCTDLQGRFEPDKICCRSRFIAGSLEGSFLLLAVYFPCAQLSYVVKCPEVKFFYASCRFDLYPVASPLRRLLEKVYVSRNTQNAGFLSCGAMAYKGTIARARS